MTVYTNTLKRIFKIPFNWFFMFLFPVIFLVLISVSISDDEVADPLANTLPFGIVDLDNSSLSKVLIEKLEARFIVLEIAQIDINSTLTEQTVPWILLIPDGYGADITQGNTPVLEGYSLTITDVSEIGTAYAESITRSLMLLGSDDETILSEWVKTSELTVTTAPKSSDWGLITFWFGFFGFVAIYTAYFVSKTLTDDKKRGMPDRLGVIPASPRKHLISSALAAFTATEISVAALMLVVIVLLGVVPNMFLLFLLLSLFNLFSVCLVLAILSMAKDLGAGSVIVTMTAVIFSMLGGVFWPLDLVPEYMQKAAYFSPGYWLVRGIGGVQDISFEGFGMSVLFLTGFTIVAILLGGWKSIQKMEDDN
ncbi:MAG: ABC transporter permease [Oscillospiraceae bacterium]|nr:ABC transporter permease [Oscillospiraceae bacterium]